MKKILAKFKTRTLHPTYLPYGELDPSSLAQFQRAARIEKIISNDNPENAQSWYGGKPRMPSTIPWPMDEGEPMLFLAQLHCAGFPDALWGGVGPRTGWLLFFMGPTEKPEGPPQGYPVKVIHIDKLGPEQHMQATKEVEWLRNRREHPQPENGPAFNKWPVKIYEQTAGSDECTARCQNKSAQQGSNSRPWPGGAAGNPITHDGLHQMLDAMIARVKKIIEGAEKVADRLGKTVSQPLPIFDESEPDTQDLQYKKAVAQAALPKMAPLLEANKQTLEQLSALRADLDLEPNDILLETNSWLGILEKLTQIDFATFKWIEISIGTMAVTNPEFQVKTAVVTRKETWGEQAIALRILGGKLASLGADMHRTVAANKRKVSEILAKPTSKGASLSDEQQAEFDRLNQNIAKTEQAFSVQIKTPETLGPLNQEANAHDANAPVTDQDWANISAQVSKITFAECTWKIVTPAIPSRNELEFNKGPITSLDTDTSYGNWRQTFEDCRRINAAKIYTKNRSALPNAVRAHFESIWALDAGDKNDGMGGMPRWDAADYMLFGGPLYYSAADKKRWFSEPYNDLPEHPFDRDNALLLQLFSNTILNWVWGDASHICLVIPRHDLSKNRFDRVMVVISG